EFGYRRTSMSELHARPDAERARRLERGRDAERVAGDRALLDLVAAVRQVVRVDVAGDATPVDGERLLQPDVERRREGKARSAARERADEVEPLPEIRDDHEPRERLAVVIARDRAERDVGGKAVDAGDLAGERAIAEQPPAVVDRRIRKQRILADKTLIVLAAPEPAAGGAPFGFVRRGAERDEQARAGVLDVQLRAEPSGGRAADVGQQVVERIR